MVRWPVRIWWRVLIWALMMSLAGDQISTASAFWGNSLNKEVKALKKRLADSETVAVSYITRDDTGYVTGLGNLWRGYMEKALLKQKIQVKSRAGLGQVASDLDIFGCDDTSGELFEKLAADVILAGIYRIDTEHKKLHFQIRATRSTGGEVYVLVWSERLPGNYVKTDSNVRGNIHQKAVEKITGAGSNQPRLHARLDRLPPCYDPGADCRITVDTETGVYLYILGIQADMTVARIYPNTFMPEQSMMATRFVFPPPEVKRLGGLKLYPLKNDEPCREAFKVIATRSPIDLSFLPEPLGQMFVGAKGGDLRLMEAAIEAIPCRSVVDLPYTVDAGCR